MILKYLWAKFIIDLFLIPSIIAVTNLYAKFWTLRKKFSVDHFVALCRIQNRLHDKPIKHANVVIRIKNPKKFENNVIHGLLFSVLDFLVSIHYIHSKCLVHLLTYLLSFEPMPNTMVKTVIWKENIVLLLPNHELNNKH